MAKIGEGDPRWIVAERTDGQNVNAWHWEEKDVTKQVHDNLKQAFAGLSLCDGEEGMTIKVKEISEISGDVSVAQRKGRIMCYFDIKMTIKYEGTLKTCADKIEGKMTLPEVEHENFESDFTIDVAAIDFKAQNVKAEAWVKANGRSIIRRNVSSMIRALFSEYRVGTNVKTGQPITPLTKGAGGSPGTPPTSSAVAAPPKAASSSSSSSSTGGITKFDYKMDWRIPVEELWTTLTDERRASAYTRGAAKINPQPAGEFSYLGGVISGYFVEVTHPGKLTMQWRLNAWPAGVFSTVVMVLSREDASTTRLEFAQAGIPEGDVDRVKQGWQVNFWDAIKAVFGYSYNWV